MWPNPQFPADLVRFTEEVRKGKLHFCVMQLTLFWSMFPFYTSCKHQKTKDFLEFQGVENEELGQEWVQEKPELQPYC